jgi:hypothetical protein
LDFGELLLKLSLFFCCRIRRCLLNRGLLLVGLCLNLGPFLSFLLAERRQFRLKRPLVELVLRVVNAVLQALAFGGCRFFETLQLVGQLLLLIF